MKKFFLFFSLLAVTALFAKDYPTRGGNFTAVKFNDNFRLPQTKIDHTVTIPVSVERRESTGRVKNFEMAATKPAASAPDSPSAIQQYYLQLKNLKLYK